MTAIALGGLILAESALAEVGNRAEGRKLAGQCRTCHGLDGDAQMPVAPTIGGESEAYIRNQLTAFRDGTREHEMMTIVARNLSDQHIADLAAWYSGHKITATLSADPTQAPQECVACHGAEGIRQMEDAPNLAGETNIYIDTQLKAFRNGTRKNDIMSPIAAELTDAQIRAIADWYGAIKTEITLTE
nr:c-type cytochrome [Paracoccus ravus]